MAISTLAALQTALTSGIFVGGSNRRFSSDTPTYPGVRNVWSGASFVDGEPGGGEGSDEPVPSTAIALDFTGTKGFMSIQHPASNGNLCLVEAHSEVVQTYRPMASAELIDRLSHNGGMSANDATLQTTNLPTAALTRYTDGVGVRAALSLYDDTGSTNASITCQYTNQAGTGSRTGTIPLISPTGQKGSFFTFSLEGTDTGVRSVESITYSAATGVAGDVGVVLYKPLVLIPPGHYHDVSTLFGWSTPILSEAHLDLMLMGFGAEAIQSPAYQFGFAEL